MMRRLLARIAPAPADRRALFLGSLIVVPALVIQLGLRPLFRSWSATSAELATERGLLAREEGLVAASASWPARAQTGERDLLAAAPALFDGRDLVAASGTLAGVAAQRATAHRVFIQQTELRPSAEVGGEVTSLAIDVRGASDLRGLLGWIADLEAGKRLIRVERIHFERSPSVDPAIDDETISFSATLRGFALTADSTSGVAR